MLEKNKKPPSNSMFRRGKNVSERRIPALAVFLVALMLSAGLFVVANQKAPSAVSADPVVASLKTNGVGDEADSFFDDGFVHEIRLYFEDNNWYETLYTAHQNNPEDPYFQARFVYNGTVLDPVGVRFKGLSSFSSNGEKKPFLIDFNEYQEDNQAGVEQTFFGLKKLNLNNCFSDATMMREKLFLDFASQYVAVPRAVYTKLYINNEYFGLYLAVEQIDQVFIESRFGKNENGNLYKVEAGFLNYLGADMQSYNGSYELKTNLKGGNWSDLLALIKVLNSSSTYAWSYLLESVLDVDSTLYSLALLNVFSSLDSYLASGRNYYLYHRQDTSQFTMLICDFNMAFGGFGGFSAGDSDNQTTIDPFYSQATTTLGQRVSANMTVGGVSPNMTSPLSPSNAPGGFPFNSTMTPPLNNTRPFPGNMTLPWNPQNATGLPGNLPDGFQRNNTLPSNVTGGFGVAGGAFASGEQVLLTRMLGVDASNRTYLRAMAQILRDCFNGDTINTRIQELADIIRADVYNEPNTGSDSGTSLGLTGQGMAQNWLRGDAQSNMTTAQAFENGLTSLVAFVEERFAFLDSRLNDFVQDTDLKLNDLMSLNINTFTDYSGKSAPWLELYNMGPGEISTAGFFLTDDPSTPDKWALPEQSLAGGSFLLLWLDGEPSAGLYSAPFSLSASGGDLFLYKQNSSGYVLVDSVNYPSLDADVSYSRFPDGVGEWYKIGDGATPAASNHVQAGAVLVPGKLFINELMADNDAAVIGPSGAYPDWVELYNGGDYMVDISGMYLTDDLSNPSWRFPDGAFIAPNSYLLVWADGGSGKSYLHASFKLRANGGAVGLFASDGKTLIDFIVFGKQIRDVSYGRAVDGSLSWSYLANPTAGSSNKLQTQNTEGVVWPVWAFIVLSLAGCVLVVMWNKNQGRLT